MHARARGTSSKCACRPAVVIAHVQRLARLPSCGQTTRAGSLTQKHLVETRVAERESKGRHGKGGLRVDPTQHGALVLEGLLAAGALLGIEALGEGRGGGPERGVRAIELLVSPGERSEERQGDGKKTVSGRGKPRGARLPSSRHVHCDGSAASLLLARFFPIEIMGLRQVGGNPPRLSEQRCDVVAGCSRDAEGDRGELEEALLSPHHAVLVALPTLANGNADGCDSHAAEGDETHGSGNGRSTRQARLRGRPHHLREEGARRGWCVSGRRSASNRESEMLKADGGFEVGEAMGEEGDGEEGWEKE